MIFIYMIMPFLVPVILAPGISECNITQCDKECQCYVAPGEPLIFYLPIQTAKITLMKNNKVLFRCGNNTCKKTTFKYIKSCKFVMNGAVKCGHIIINESGVYQMDLYGNDGKSIKKINISLQITAPVSQPAIFQKCLSPEQRTVSCSAEGDDTQFSFSLDNNLLQHTKPASGYNRSVTISLNGQLEGNLECKVQNKISSKQIIVHLSRCEGDAEEEIIYSDVRVNHAARKRDG
ncbi:uncharacterized protein LOC114153211 [Xiphophorus couchianus]|uniref:uncharacterized protein LOC114153211 n=1 Tax=Xiphophorus couchianus TaxID=32473 RepID=UPI001016AE79|nr:uncharacterized protein LOC114153211 [Xiphophorus couchianus]